MAQNYIEMAVMFADLADSTRLYESLGDTYAFSAVRNAIKLLSGVTGGFGGRVVKTIGDGMMCVFSTADGAASAAREMQAQVAQWPSLSNGKQLSIRVGFRFGAVIPDGDDVFGDSVNVASRLCSLALGGQTLTDAATVARLGPALRELTRPLNAMPVKGKAEEVEVHEFVWQASDEHTMIPGRRAAAPVTVVPDVPRISIHHDGTDRVFSDAVIYFGREAAGNHVVVASPVISRRHAKIELRAGKFVLIDQSSNGTFAMIGDAPEVRLMREEVILFGSGHITLGQGATEPGAVSLQYRCL